MRNYKIKKAGKDFNFLSENTIIKGSRHKRLVIDRDKKIAMFKYERKNYICSEACSEKIAYEVAKRLNYECARIELAKDSENKTGVLNYIFSNKKTSPHTDIVAYLNKDSDQRNKFYTISNIKKTLDELDKNLFKGFIKIMVFDALIGEQDRHEENWGITEKEGKYYISPLYDNGDSLLREFKNEDILKKYCNGTKKFDSYINRSKSIIYMEDNKKNYKHFDLINYLYDNYPKIVKSEINNLNKLTDKDINDIVNKIPEELLTITHKKYIIMYLEKRKNILLNIIKEGEDNEK